MRRGPVISAMDFFRNLNGSCQKSQEEQIRRLEAGDWDVGQVFVGGNNVSPDQNPEPFNRYPKLFGGLRLRVVTLTCV